MGSVEADELRHDREGSKRLEAAQHYLSAAADDLIDRLFAGKKVGRYGLDAYVEQFAEEIAAKIITHQVSAEFESWLEDRIRRELQDSDEVLELASDMAEEIPECRRGEDE